jgi:alpha,alpha-trehalose phosphorylase
VANEQLPAPASADPRTAAALDNPLAGEYQNADGTVVVLTHSTRLSGINVAAAMDHLIDGPPGVLVESRVFPDGGLVTAATMLEPGQKLRVIKFVAYGSSSERSLTAVRDQAWAALSAARHSG